MSDGQKDFSIGAPGDSEYLGQAGNFSVIYFNNTEISGNIQIDIYGMGPSPLPSLSISSLLRNDDVISTSDIKQPILSEGSHIGHSMISLDLNLDGYDDLIVSQPAAFNEK